MADGGIQQFWYTVLAGCIGAVVGATVSGFISARATRLQFKRTLDDRDQLDRKNESALLEVLKGDLLALVKLHAQVRGILVGLKEGEVLSYHIPISLNYFTVFEQNVTQLGRIGDSQLRTKIIFVYQIAKSLVDSLRRNNEVLAELKRWEIENMKSEGAVSQKQIDALEAYLVRYAVTIKQSSQELSEGINETLEMIGRSGATENKRNDRNATV